MKVISAVVIALILIAGAAALYQVNDPDDSASQAANAAYRDGIYQGKLAAARGLNPHVTLARWGSEDDRTSFVAGYEQGYTETAAISSRASHAASAPFRDGLFVGSLAMQRTDASRIPVARWATERDRSQFAEGYRQASGVGLGVDETARNIHSSDSSLGNTRP